VIDHLNNLLRHVLLSGVDELTDESQVRFDPPDADWRTYVANLTVNGQPVNAVNVYLADLRENRVLRSNERLREHRNGLVTELPAPARMDCHYLLSTWSPATSAAAVEPVLDEHALLYKVATVLFLTGALVPREVYAPSPVPATFPPDLVDTELPLAVLPTEGFVKLSEFWTTMEWRWKPALYLIATVPVAMSANLLGPMVTTRIVEMRLPGSVSAVESFIEIGGHVRDAGSGAAIGGAWVRIEDSLGRAIEVAQTDAAGRFQFGGLTSGTYTLRVRATGFAETTRTVDVPSEVGNYDVSLA
jgi:hypothetical protein